jgi:hypothetical protein
MKRQFVSRVLVAVGLVSTLLFTATAEAATIRGRLEHVYPNGVRGPAAGLVVTVYSPTLGRSNPSYSGQDGMFYLQGIPPGAYRLEIWYSPYSQPIVYSIQVQEPYTDIPPLNV